MSDMDRIIRQQHELELDLQVIAKLEDDVDALRETLAQLLVKMLAGTATDRDVDNAKAVLSATAPQPRPEAS